MKIKRLTPLLTALLTLIPSAAAFACPMCKDSIPNSDAPSASNVGNGFNLSVYFMLIGFFSVTGLVGGMMVREIRRSNRN